MEQCYGCKSLAERIEQTERALDAEREKVANLDAMYRQQLGDRDARIEALAGSAKIWMGRSTQLHALVRAYATVKVEFDERRLHEDHHEGKQRFHRLDMAETALIDYVRTLDATTPAECPNCDGDGAVGSGGTDPNGNPLMRRCGCREKGGDGE